MQFFIHGPHDDAKPGCYRCNVYILEDGTVTISLRNRASVVHDISISTLWKRYSTINVLLLRLLILSKLPMDGLNVIHLSSISWI